MKFLVDRCAGRRFAAWLRARGHDVLEARDLGPDPGDGALLKRARTEDQILVTIDTDFGELICLHDVLHAGLVRLPDVPAERRIALMVEIMERHCRALEAGEVVTVRGARIRISRSPSFQLASEVWSILELEETCGKGTRGGSRARSTPAHRDPGHGRTRGEPTENGT